MHDDLPARFIQSSDYTKKCELNGDTASGARREELVFEKWDFPRNAVLAMKDVVNTAGRDSLTAGVRTHRHGTPPFTISCLLRERRVGVTYDATQTPLGWRI
jgi:hypothetical protein